MKKVFEVELPVEECKEMEEAWYDYNGALAMSKEFMKDKDIDMEMMAKFTKLVKEKWEVAERAKEKFGKQYAPAEVDLKKFNYAFDFEKHIITYEEA